MAESRQRGVVGKPVFTQPPAAEHRCHKGGEDTADVDEYVEDLEACVTLGCITRIVVKLADYGLEIAFEETVSERDHKQRETCQCQQPCLIVGSSEDGECKDHISGRHDYETPDDGRFVVLCLVRDKTADEAQHIDACIETGIDDRAGFLFKSEFRTEEQHQYCVHDVVSEPLAHVGKGRRVSDLWDGF